MRGGVTVTGNIQYVTQACLWFTKPKFRYFRQILATFCLVTNFEFASPSRFLVHWGSQNQGSHQLGGHNFRMPNYIASKLSGNSRCKTKQVLRCLLRIDESVHSKETQVSQPTSGCVRNAANLAGGLGKISSLRGC